MLHKVVYCCLWYFLYLPLALFFAGLICAGIIWLTGWRWTILVVPPLALIGAYEMVKSRLEDMEIAGFKQSVEQMSNRLVR